VLTALFYR